jgi:hypothetical protein
MIALLSAAACGPIVSRGIGFPPLFLSWAVLRDREATMRRAEEILEDGMKQVAEEWGLLTTISAPRTSV